MYIYNVLVAGAGGEGSACADCCCDVCMHTSIMWPRVCAGDGYSRRCTTAVSLCCVCMYMCMTDRGCVCAGGEGSACAGARWPAALQVHV